MAPFTVRTAIGLALVLTAQDGAVAAEAPHPRLSSTGVARAEIRQAITLRTTDGVLVAGVPVTLWQSIRTRRCPVEDGLPRSCIMIVRDLD